MSAKIAEIEQTLRKMLNIDVDDTQRNSTCGAKNEYPCHREHIDSHKNILDSHSLSDLEKSLKHQPSGPPPISPFSRQKSRDRSKTMTNNVFKYDSDCCSVKKPSDYIGCQLSHPTQTFLAIGKNQTFENRDCSKTSTKLRKGDV